MTATAAKLIDEFKSLPPAEQLSVWHEIARVVAPPGYGPLEDDQLTAIADQTFVLMDKEEAHAKPR